MYLRVLDHDPDLARGLGAADFEEARRQSVAPRIGADVGPWSTDVEPPPESGTLALLVLEGLLAREVALGKHSTLEHLGRGDVLRPWTWTGGQACTVSAEASWQICEPTVFALLDRDFAMRMAPWPEVVATVTERATERAMSLTVQLTIRQAKADERILLTLWHLADRWGRVSADGVVLHIPRLTHDTIARMIGASRPTVSTVIGELRDRALIAPHPDGRWLLSGDPPAELLRARRGAHSHAVAPAALG